MKINDFFENEEDKQIVIKSAVIALVITILFAVFVFVYTSIYPKP